MTYETMMALLAPFLVIAVIWGLIGLAFFIWYLAAMARLFPLIGLPAGQGWIPLWNDWRLIGRAGLPGWVAILYLVPGANIVAVVFRTIAQHRIGREAGVGAGYTVLGLVLPPLWATLIGSIIGPQGLRPPSAPFASGFGAAPFTGGFGTGPAAPVAAAGSSASAVPGFPGALPAAALPAAAQPPAAPVFSQSTGFAVPVAPQAPAAPDPWASPAQTGSFVPPVTAAPAAAPAPPPPAPLLAGPLGSETEAEYARLAAEPFQAPPAVPLGQAAAAEPFSWTAASQPVPEPVTAPEVVPPPVHPLAAQPVPVAQPAPEAQAPPATQPPAVAEAAAPVAPPPAPPAEPVAAPVAALPAPYAARLPEPPPAPVPAAYNPTGITDSYERLVAEDDLDRTVVVPRAQRIGWAIELPGGERFELPAFDVIVGRRPEAQGDARPLAIPDPTRTLSKTHARLRFDGEQWTVEDLGSTNGVVLLLEGEREEELTAYRPAPATDRLLLGTLELRLSRSDETA